ncbi:uncharacterized protein SCHCODRAFT_02506744 [Schizophyllum commune H4-8]|uniref:Expressed protein n=1 Tax=Schizophyllum commune (strain H4-8 / FGSC 9210) TaxID=578458 RepID=D8Q7S6_SCHCM|nr:uncharacterized protein SCHCODRAFT_02506744 [Schizophyllum commune H4-8]KAI5891364.1 hypothetical protein SCHCODRAFT_02506744 [Schizophyllum commune H4-8]
MTPLLLCLPHVSALERVPYLSISYFPKPLMTVSRATNPPHTSTNTTYISNLPHILQRLRTSSQLPWSRRTSISLYLPLIHLHWSSLSTYVNCISIVPVFGLLRELYNGVLTLPGALGQLGPTRCSIVVSWSMSVNI